MDDYYCWDLETRRYCDDYESVEAFIKTWERRQLSEVREYSSFWMGIEMPAFESYGIMDYEYYIERKPRKLKPNYYIDNNARIKPVNKYKHTSQKSQRYLKRQYK